MQKKYHKNILAIALPMLASNISEPLIGIVDTMIIGRSPEKYLIGAVAIGAALFGILFWGFSFLRMGVTGQTAQEKGAQNYTELTHILMRSIFIALICGIILVISAPLIENIAFLLFEASQNAEAEAKKYFNIRIYSAPFALTNYVFLGWFIGIGNAKIALVLQLLLNITNIILDLIFVIGFNMGVEGVALGTLIAAIIATIGGSGAVIYQNKKFKKQTKNIWDRKNILNKEKIIQTIKVNSDIMIRTLCLMFTFTFFTAQGAKNGDVILAANAILLNLLTLFAHLLDAFAIAAETLTGQAIGAKQKYQFRQNIKISFLWAGLISVLLTIITIMAGKYYVYLMTVNHDIQNAAMIYLPWAAIAPIVAVSCFQLDGIFIGATRTADLRNMMIISLAAYLIAWAILTPIFHNHGLWAALMIFFIIRAITLAGRVPNLEKNAFKSNHS